MPDIERLYTQYIAGYSSAVRHLKSLSNKPELDAYFAQTQVHSSLLSRTLNLQFLLVKPVQRLSMYSLLLDAILYQTPDSHPDEGNLRFAKARIQKLLLVFREQRDRMEVKKITLDDAQKQNLTSNLSSVPSATHSHSKGLNTAYPFTDEADKLRRLGDELQKIKLFVTEFVKTVYG
ncbi:hypothetical protein GYMLUDRAFT_915608 [Collybiopsis luxurians FD-317 M1]|uniref:DH domain-containing protein n=1 Tax=Collybiopsis luxurians FD-317 M1 TaxID=944289 RepID=A0A0D0C8E4_9AGAR|nr:hypothetical protein GYMLUDRAFT_915608 [Collybiopsis luxurians FD-317 M1]